MNSPQSKKIEQQLLRFKKQYQQNKNNGVQLQEFYDKIEDYVDSYLKNHQSKLTQSKLKQYKQKFKDQFKKFEQRQQPNFTQQSATEWITKLKSSIQKECEQYKIQLEDIHQQYRKEGIKYSPNSIYNGSWAGWRQPSPFFQDFFFMINQFSGYYKFFKVKQDQKDFRNIRFPSQQKNKIGVLIIDQQLALVTKFSESIIIYPFSQQCSRYLREQNSKNLHFANCQIRSYIFLLLYISLLQINRKNELPQILGQPGYLKEIYKQTKQEGYKIVIYLIEKNPILAFVQFNHLIEKARKK